MGDLTSHEMEPIGHDDPVELAAERLVGLLLWISFAHGDEVARVVALLVAGAPELAASLVAASLV